MTQNEGVKRLSKRPPAMAATPVAFSLPIPRRAHRTGIHCREGAEDPFEAVDARHQRWSIRRVKSRVCARQSGVEVGHESTPPGHVPRLSSRWPSSCL